MNSSQQSQCKAGRQTLHILRIFFLTLFFSFLQIAYLQSHPTTISKTNGVKPIEKKMVLVPAGWYQPFLKRATNKPIAVKALKMDETPVTNAEFLAFVKANPAWRKTKVNPLFADKNYLAHWKSDLEIGTGDLNNPNAPVVNVSWFAARAYAHWAGKRLPTVPEWEHAGNGKPKDLKNKTLIAYILEWYSKPNPIILPPVKSTYQNQYGLWDMNGLVWQWVFDFNSFVTSSDSRGSNADEALMFCAAGSLGVQNKEDYASYIRFSYRGSLKGKYCIPNLGFRCVKDL
ncbi:MAG: formylglycine-generating enzyme family protein [Bacteroidetes bacterium]|nr:formylglycine-generating enzyme family protein [Bacteroidota bacterium]